MNDLLLSSCNCWACCADAITSPVADWTCLAKVCSSFSPLLILSAVPPFTFAAISRCAVAEMIPLPHAFNATKLPDPFTAESAASLKQIFKNMCSVIALSDQDFVQYSLRLTSV